ncbi:MAG: PcfJ domain-containing protein [Myxococcota bacterium]
MGRKQKLCRGTSIAAKIVMGEWQGARFPGPAPFAENCQRLARAFPRAKASSSREALVRLLSVVETRSRLLDEKTSGRRRIVSTLLDVGKFSPQWVREPEDWTVCSARPLRSLFRHLFERYPVPPFFDHALPPKGKLGSLEFDWYVHVGSGQNIRTAAGLPVSLTKREAHLMMQAPKRLPPSGALRWGRLRALGASRGFIDAFLRLPDDFERDPICMRLAALIVREAGFPRAQVGPLFDYVRHRRRQGPFSLKGRTVRALLRGMEEWHRTLREQRNRRYVWARTSGIKPLCEELNGDTVTIDELCSSAELAQEGAEMRHCVLMYDSQCLHGQASIFALHTQRSTLCRVTLRLDPTLRVAEARCFANAHPGDAEKRVIERWAALNRLELDWRSVL